MWAGPGHTFDQILFFRPKSGPAHSQNILNLKKTKKWKFSHKETRNPNSDQYKFLRMILEHTEAFRIKFMSNSKSWIQVLKNHWAESGPALGRTWFEKSGPAQSRIWNGEFSLWNRSSIWFEMLLCFQLSFLKICIDQNISFLLLYG